MAWKVKTRDFSGTTDASERDYEQRHRIIARKVAAEGMVLLKNDKKILPLAEKSKIALYGAGAVRTIKGGTGSGDVNVREVVTVLKGLQNAGFEITSMDWLQQYEDEYDKAREIWREQIWDKVDHNSTAAEGFAFFNAYTTTPFQIPAGSIPEKTDAEVAIYVLSRNAGEGADRYETQGDYYLTKEEEEVLSKICFLYQHVVFVANTGGLIDLSFMNKYHNIDGLIYMQQAGMESGNALADIMSGKVDPSGKLTDTWAFSYKDYPNSSTFSHNNGDVSKERYEEGIYIGYRYFDTFQIPARYGFGYGMTYTEFEIRTIGIEHFNLGSDEPEIAVKVLVKNIGKYSGREVIQIYVSSPQGRLAKEYRKLVEFQKTKLLLPGEKEEVLVKFPIRALSSFDEDAAGWVLDHGIYGVFTGNALETATFEGSIQLEEDIMFLKTQNICSLEEKLQEKIAPEEKIQARRNTWRKEVSHKPSIIIHAGDIKTRVAEYTEGYDTMPTDVSAFVDSLTTEQLIQLATGAISDHESNLGSAGKSVPGSAAQTSSCAMQQGLASIVLADGPAGLRLVREYQVMDEKVQSVPLEMSMEDGFLCREKPEKKGKTYYQYCTAFPVGTLLAQTWDREFLMEVGKAVGEEMQEFGITLWLAPGMNVHRNPLCGRNFEYFSEDPVLSGKLAAALTKGVQSNGGCGTTIKHFVCNNQEDNRMGSDSIVSERTLREIYLKGFEIAVRESQPMAIMTSYNLINGIHAANNHDICTKVARNEWGFKGMIMTDWTTTHYGPDCTASGCMRAGNDAVMPGTLGDHENIRQELKMGTLDIRALKRSVARLVHIIWHSNQYETEKEKDNK